MIRYLLPIAALGLLAACGDDPVAPDEDGRTASGEILEGTISDEMLPLETLKSQPPLVESSPDATGENAAGEAAGEEGEDAGDEPGDGETGEAPAEGDVPEPVDE